MEGSLFSKAVIGVAVLLVSGSANAGRQDPKSFWNVPNRYEVVTAMSVPFQVRTTPEGSLWLHAYGLKRNTTKTLQYPVPSMSEQGDWDAWIASKMEFDRWQAHVSARQLNAARGIEQPEFGSAPAAPGDMPEGLRYLVGDAPLFAVAAEPRRHRVSFGPGDVVELVDYPAMQPRFTKFRFAQGVQHFGTPVRNLPGSELKELFLKAALSVREQRIFQAVSMLEGGFESVNTYDTGWVSVGFIQFACLEGGAGSLGAVLKRMKHNSPAEFAQTFSDYGIDVAEDGALLAMDVSTGQLKKGNEAARQIILDKRLIAVFHRAGLRSGGFKTAQIQIAKEWYYPASDLVTVGFADDDRRVKVSDFIRSEAGIATLMDRKVNTGKIAPLADVVTRIAKANGLKTVAELAAFEGEIVRQMKFRKDYLADPNLTQPAARSFSRGRSKVKVVKAGPGKGAKARVTSATKTTPKRPAVAGTKRKSKGS